MRKHHHTPHLVTKGGSENTTIHHTWLQRVVQRTPPYTTFGYKGWLKMPPYTTLGYKGWSREHHTWLQRVVQGTPHLVTKGGLGDTTINHTWLHSVVQKTPPTRSECRQTRFQYNLPPPPPPNFIKSTEGDKENTAPDADGHTAHWTSLKLRHTPPPLPPPLLPPPPLSWPSSPPSC